ncbi:hypothetical protein JFN87_28535 [Streptomyces bomunensis]|uniref:Uncharacterized protein n=1 Tax=Streptomyces montanisoli TaxID=2798581 RepID=A0A940S0Y0_9ACTN|nr:hypothetical protein [Streptomyces montanisoli]
MLPAQTAAAAGPGSAYAFDPAAVRVKGAATTASAPALSVGTTYRDAIGPGAKLVYRVDLDARTSAYVSAVAVPARGSKVAYGDKIEIALQDANGRECGSNDSEFGVSTDFARPLAAYAYRTAGTSGGAGSTCAAAGTYYVVVRRTGDPASSHDPWDLELRRAAEPGLAKAGPTQAPEDWPSASPAPPAGDPRPVEGGAGFWDAARLRGSGAWSTRISPGQTLFFRVPVDWGQQLFGSVDLASAPEPPPGASRSTGGRSLGLVNGAVAMSLFNPALGFVQSANAPLYDGRQKTTSFDPLPPVAYRNRFSYRSGVRDMRFAGWYYVRVSLNPKLAGVYGKGPYGITLRLTVTGKAASAPAYAGPPGPFTVVGDHSVAGGNGAAEAGRPGCAGTMRTVGYAGVGTGTVLVLGLGVWTMAGRRRAVRTG